LLLQVALVQVAESRLQGAIDIISLGKVVVTNRLHAAIVANLLGRPLVWIDTRHKKLSGEWPLCWRSA
jgi:exopolysaccharide biosynthesis predicted pyruvyltransferase EpsI